MDGLSDYCSNCYEKGHECGECPKLEPVTRMPSHREKLLKLIRWLRAETDKNYYDQDYSAIDAQWKNLIDEVMAEQ